MDDTHTMFFVMDRAYPGRPTGEGIFWSSDPEARILPDNTSHWFGRFRSAYQAEDDYELDRQRQREDHSMWGYTGIVGVQTQDQAVTESMGGVLDRTIEHVGTADVMVLQLRRRLLEVVRMYAAGDAPPPGVEVPEVYQTRSAALRLPVGVDWVQATERVRAVELAPARARGKEA